MSALLEVAGLAGGYGASTVLHGVDLDIAEGEVVTLLGRNGMGKTTTVRMIAGLLSPRSGTVTFMGRGVAGLRAERIARMGLGLVPEGRQIFPNLTVRENLVAFAANRARNPSPWTLARVLDLLPRLDDRLDRMGDQLSGGEQQMLAIGRALMTNPHLLILDEATEGLAPLVRREIWEALAALRREGHAILVIDKHVEALTRIADRHAVIEKGRVVWTGASAELAADRTVWARYLGV